MKIDRFLIQDFRSFNQKKDTESIIALTYEEIKI